MNEFNIKTLTPAHWMLYRSVRLNSLKDSPDSFGSTYAQEALLSEIEWQSRLDLKSRNVKALPLIAVIEGQPVGIAWGFIHKRNLDVAHIYQMWVSPEYRGIGIAKSLLFNIKSWALNNGCTLMALSVTINNEAAVNLYSAFGFVATGPLEPLRVNAPLLVQPMTMVLNNSE